MWAGWGKGGFYEIDDFKIEVSRADTMAVTDDTADIWQLTDADSVSGSFSWWCGNPNTDNLTGGLDNSLLTVPIDLTNAQSAVFSAFFKFNINTSTGRPPDGFRVEVSSDLGVTWKSITLGVRSAWGVSGSESDTYGGEPADGKSYTGIDTDGDKWVEAGTLTRLNTDLSAWSGSVILISARPTTRTPLRDLEECMLTT